MNYIECFNRFRAANCLQPVFFRSWCALMLPGVEYCRRALCAFLVRLDAARCGVLQPVHPLRCSWCLDAARCGVLPVHLFAPFLVRLNAARCGVLPPCTLCAFLVRLNAARCGVLPPCPLRLPGAPRCCQVWSVTRAPLRRSWCLDAARCGVLPVVPFAPVLVPSWCPLCYVIHIIVYHRF